MPRRSASGHAGDTPPDASPSPNGAAGGGERLSSIVVIADPRQRACLGGVSVALSDWYRARQHLEFPTSVAECLDTLGNRHEIGCLDRAGDDPGLEVVQQRRNAVKRVS